MNNLHALANAAGLQIDWQDALGNPQRVSDEDLALVLNALGFPADNERAVADSRRKLAEDVGETGGFVSAEIGRPINLPSSSAAPGLGELILENGTRRDVWIEQGGAGLSLSPIDATGYHLLHFGGREIALAIAPQHCFRVEDAASGRKIWGPAVQIPALRDDRPQAYGDFGTLAQAAKSFAARGADAIAISPVHALFPADATRYSPYAPSSRLFLNVLYADPALIGEPLPPENGAELIDWETMIPRRLEQMLAIYRRTSGQAREAVADFRCAQGRDLEAHATFDALHAHFFSSGASGWQDWPTQFHDPAGRAVGEFAAGHAEQIGFYAFLQWLAKKGLDAAQKAAVDNGMAIGLIADLAVGMDPGGSHVWSRPQDVLSGLTIGAPPDLLGPDGQNWGITGFSPHALRKTGFEGYIATLRAALGSAGGIRIDHALGLRRLWVVPEGAPASQGAYLTFPMEDMLRILALESQRSKAIVIGEDLGTVPEGLRPAMDERAMLGMRVLWFERDDEGTFVPPSSWSRDAAAMTGTHDLPTVAGWWSGRDIDWTWKLGRTSRAVDESADRASRAEEREVLWKAFDEAGLVDGSQPEPDDTAAIVDAGVTYVGSTPSVLAILPMEDIVGLDEQPNLPGTIDEHPNWRRRMPGETEALLNDFPVAARIDLLNKARRS